MQVRVNGQAEEVPAESTIAALVGILGLAEARLAIELNKRIVERGRWQQTRLEEEDNVEIVEFVGGG